MPQPLLAPENDYRSLMEREIDSPTLRIAIVIPVYNRLDLLKSTLAGVATQTYPDRLLSVVVADDGSDEDVEAAVQEVALGVDLSVVRREHQGYGAGQARNLGAQHANQADVLVFFDADCIPDPQAVERHAVWHHLADNLVVVGSRHHLDTSGVSHQDIAEESVSLRHLAFDDEDPSPEVWPSEDHRKVLHRRTAALRHGDMGFRSLVSSNFSVGAQTFSKVGGFSSDFRRWGGEDTELGWRLWNHGVFFIDEPTAAIYHQTQADAGDEGWRERSRAANDGLIQSKIPHRHYRKALSGVINEAPKVSVLVHTPEPQRLAELSRQIFGQRLDDLEVLLVGTGEEVHSFTERRHADPRFASAATMEEATKLARGEFVAMVHGSVGLDHRLLSRSVAALEGRPDMGWVKSAYGIPTTGGLDIYRREIDTSLLNTRWSGSIPLFGLVRRRELMKGLNAGLAFADAWEWVTENLEAVAHGRPLVIVPGEDPASVEVESVEPPTSLRSMVVSDLKAGGRTAAISPVRALRSMVTGAPYRSTGAPAARPVKPSPDLEPSVRYVGWTGRHNLGDEAMLEAVRGLLPGITIATSGERSDLLMLGGGTLINRGYLRRLRPLDSPRIERVAFGTGVANPSYWGEPKERTEDWLDFLESCLLVGVRGPLSAGLLSDWGLKREVEMIGDPALSLSPDASVEVVSGRVVVCPAWSHGMLWGDSDEDVIAAFSRLVERLRKDGHEVWALSAFPGDDSHLIEMMREAGAPELPYVAAHDDPQTAIELLSSAELVVSERLHGAVLAAAAGTVPVMVEYRPKLRDFAASLALEELCITTDELAGDSLFDVTRHAFDRRTELRQGMLTRVEDFRSRQRDAANAIHQTLTG